MSSGAHYSGPESRMQQPISNARKLFQVSLSTACFDTFDRQLRDCSLLSDATDGKCFRVYLHKDSESRFVAFELVNQPSDCLVILYELKSIVAEIYTEHNLTLDPNSLHADLLKPFRATLEHVPVSATTAATSMNRSLRKALKDTEKSENSLLEVMIILMAVTSMLKKYKNEPSKLVSLVQDILKIWQEIQRKEFFRDKDFQVLRQTNKAIAQFAQLTRNIPTYQNLQEISKLNQELRSFLEEFPANFGFLLESPAIHTTAARTTATAVSSPLYSTDAGSYTPMAQRTAQPSPAMTESAVRTALKNSNPFLDADDDDQVAPPALKQPEKSDGRMLMEDEIEVRQQIPDQSDFSKFIDTYSSSDTSSKAFHSIGTEDQPASNNGPSSPGRIQGASPEPGSRPTNHQTGSSGDSEFPPLQQVYGSSGAVNYNTAQAQTPAKPEHSQISERVRPFIACLDRILREHRVVCQDTFLFECANNSEFRNFIQQISLLDVQHATRDLSEITANNFYKRNKFTPRAIPSRSGMTYRDELADCKAAIFEWIVHSELAGKSRSFYCLGENARNLPGATYLSKQALILQMHRAPGRFHSYALNEEQLKHLLTMANSVSVTGEERRAFTRLAYLALCTIPSVPHPENFLGGVTLMDMFQRYFEELGRDNTISRPIFDFHVSLMKRFDPVLKTVPRDSLAAFVKVMSRTMENSGGHYKTEELDRTLYMLSSDAYPEFLTGFIVEDLCSQDLKALGWFEKFLNFFGVKDNEKRQSKVVETLAANLKRSMFAHPPTALVNMVTRPTESVEKKAFDFVTSPNACKVPQFKDLADWIQVSFYRIFTELVNKQLPCSLGRELYLAEAETLRLFESCQVHDKLTKKDYTPQGVNKEALSQVLRESNEALAKAKEYQTLLEKLSDSRQLAFSMLDQHSIQSDYKRLADDKSLTIGQVTSIGSRLKDCAATFRTASLIDVNAYQELLQSAADDLRIQKQSSLSLRDFDKLCLEVEERLRTLLVTFVEGIDSKLIDKVLKLRHDILLQKKGHHGETINLLVENRIITEPHRETLVHMLNLLCLLIPAEDMQASFGKIYRTLKDKKFDAAAMQRTEGQDPLNVVINKVVQIGHKLKSTGRVQVDVLAQFDKQERQLMEFLHRNDLLLTKLGDCMDVLKHFAEKDNKHYEEIYFEADGAIKIEPHITTSARTLVAAYKSKDLFSDLESFLKEVAKKSHQIQAADLALKSKDLIECSKTLLADNLDGKKSAFEILEGSVMVFRVSPSLVAYDVYCETNIDIEGLKQRGLDAPPEGRQKAKPADVQKKSQQTKHSEKKIPIEKLQDTKIKVSLYKDHLKRQPASAFVAQSADTMEMEADVGAEPSQQIVAQDTKRIDLFERIIDSVQSISDSLHRIVRSGSIYDLTAILQTQVSTLAQSGSAGARDSSQALDYYCYTEALTLCVQTHRMAHLGGNRAAQQTEQNHFEVLKDVLEAIAAKAEQQMMNKDLAFHNIRFLRSYQRIMICRYLEFNEVRGAKDQQDQDLALLVSIFKFMLPSLPPAEVAPKQVKKWRKICSNMRSLDGFTENLLVKFQTELVQESSTMNSSRTQFRKSGTQAQEQEIEDAQKKIKFFKTTEQNQFKNLLDLTSLKGEKQIQPQRIFFGDQQTSIFDLKNFLICALTDPQRQFYALLDLHLLSSELQGEMVLVCKTLLQMKDFVVNDNITILVASKESRLSELHQHLARSPEYFASDTQENRTVLNNLPADFHVVTSARAGLGKTTYIEKKASDSTKELCTIILSGESCKQGLASRLTKLANSSRTSGRDLLLHIKLDSMDDMQISCKYVDQFLFNLVCLKCVPFNQGFLFTEKIKATYIEVQNSYKDLILEQVRMLSFDKQPHELGNLKVASFKREFRPTLATRTAHTAEDTETMVETHQEQPFSNSEMWAFLGAFLDAYQNKHFGTQRIEVPAGASRDMSQEKLANQVLDLMKIICSNEREVEALISQASYTQINYWLNTVYFQMSELNNVAGLDPTSYQEQGSRQVSPVLRDLATIREKTGKSVIELAKQLVWSVADTLQRESTLAKKIARDAGASGLSPSQDKELKDYEALVKSIPKWELGSNVNYFFYKGAMKIIYQNPERVDHSIREIVKNQTKQELLDYRRIAGANEKLAQELIQALSMETDVALGAKLANDNKWMTVARDMRISQYLSDQMRTFNQKGYVITHDSYMKILMIVQRAILGIPVVIMGGTGCGKTYMVDFIGSCLFQETFECFTLHTGVTEQDLAQKLLAVLRLVNSPEMSSKRIWFLFDEFNTSPLQSLITEIIIERRSSFCPDLAGKVFPPNIIFIAACNPFRIKVQTSDVGLIHESSVSLLSHRVYPIPESLISNIWDFGQLTKEVEEQYIESMVSTSAKLKDSKIKSSIIKSIQICQEHFRSGTCHNTVSLRDVNRFIELFDFLKKYFTLHQSLVMTIALCYIFRLETKPEKKKLSDKLDRELGNRLAARGDLGRILAPETMDQDTVAAEPESKQITSVMKECLDSFAADLRGLKILPPGVMLNKPLLENLFATWVCILTNTPLIICGKPGTSKTLSIRVIGDALNLQHGRRADSVYFGNAPRVTYRNFWGSLTTTSTSIGKIFEKAESIIAKDRFPEGNQVCIVFDEIGLAEIAPDNPLKVLHPLLEPKERRVGFIGLSNWRLDLSKMNRVLYVARPDMDWEDLNETCDVNVFIKSLKNVSVQRRFKTLITDRFESLSKAYAKFRDKEMNTKGPGTHPNFHGSRDFYETVKIFKHNFELIFDQQSDLSELQEQAIEDELDLEDQELVDGLVLNALQRNFSGKVFQDAKSHEVIMKMYLEQIKQHVNSKVASAPAIELIYQNLLDETSRHLMILSSMNFVQDLIIQQITEFETTSRKKDPSKVVYLVPSKDKEDMIQVIKSKLPVYIKNGYTVIMKDLNELYGCMYDLLNRNYSKREGELACDLFIDNISQQVIVHPQFKCIILMDELDKATTGKDIEKKQQPPFFNRFEKYIITEEDFIPKAYLHVKNELLKKLQMSKETGKSSTSAQCLHHNLSREMVFSIVVKDTSEVKKKLKFEQKDQMSILKLLLEQTTKRSKKHKGLEDMEEDHSGIEDPEVEEKLIRLHSRNALLLREINTKEVTDCKQYHNIFMKTHPHDSLIDLQVALETNPANKRAVVFTYSSAFELKEMAEKYANTFHLLEAGELYRRYTSRQESCFREVLLENDKTLLVQFTKKKDWKLMQQIKFGIDKAILETKKAKPIIFVAQYIHGDFKLQMDEFHCGITYFTEHWQMHVIDNLKSCKYDQFLQTLHKKCYEVLDQDSKEHIQDAISKHFLHNSRDYADVVRGDSCKQLISQSALLVSMIREDTLRSIKMDKVGKDTVIKMLENKSKKNSSQLFSDHNDCYYLVQDLLKELFVSQIQKAIKKVEDSVNIRNLILLKNLHPGNEKFITEFLEVTTAAEINSDQQVPNRTSQFDQRTSSNILDAIKVSEAKIDDILKESRRHVVELQNRLSGISQGGVANLERLNEYFAHLKTTIAMFSKEKYFKAQKHLTETKDPRFALLAAIHHFQLFLANHYKHLQEYPIFEIVLYTSVQILARLYPLKSSNECDYTYREAITALLLVTKIYAEEFSALNSVIQESNLTAREMEKTLKTDIIESIMSKGVIELQQYIKSIQKLKEITGDTKSGLESQLKKIELSYRLSMLVKNKTSHPDTVQISRAREDTMMDTDEAVQEAQPRDSAVPEISVAFSDHQIAMKVIRYIEKTPGNPGKVLLKFYNEVCREMQSQNNYDNPFGEHESKSTFITFSIEFLRRIFEQHDIPSVVGGKLLSEISSHLLEIDQQEPMEHLEKIVGLLLVYVKHKLKNPRKPQPAAQGEQPNPIQDILELDQETKPEIILLSKLAIFNIYPDNQDPRRARFNASEVLTRQINRELAEFDPQTRKRFYQKLNHRIICFACASAHIFTGRDGQVPLDNIAEKVRTIQTSLFSETPTVFDAKTITAFAVFKNLLQRLKENTNNPESAATQSQKSKRAVDFAAVQQLDEECARVSAQRRSEVDKEFGLVLFHAIYSMIPSIRQLRARGLNELATRIQKLQDSSDREFVLPDMNLHGELKAFITGIPFQQSPVDPLTVTPEMAMQFMVPIQFADQMRHVARQPQLAAPRHQATLDTFYLGVHLANKFLSPQPSMDEVRILLDRVQDAPYRPFIDALMNKAFTATDAEPVAPSLELRNPFETTMMDPEPAPVPQQVPQQAATSTHFRRLEPVAEGSIKENMPFYLSVGLVLNFVANLPEGFTYSAKSPAQTLQNFQPLLNYPGPEVSKMQVISRFYELSRNTVGTAAGPIFTALWECATPKCGYLVPIGDCGNLGHGTTDNISSVCLGCKRAIGTLGNGNSNLIRRDLNQALAKFRDHLSRDETPYRPEPKQPNAKLADKFDDSWVLMKYYEDISDRSTAIFVNFVQNVIIYGMETNNVLNPFDNLLNLQDRRMTDTEKLLKRDYELLRDVLGRDDQSLFEIFNLVFYRIYHEIQSGLQDAATPRGLRSKLGKGFSSVALLDKDKRPSRALEQYYAIKQRVLKSEGERNVQILALLSGKLSAEVINNKFTSNQVFGFYLNKADAQVNLQMIDTKLEDQMKSVTQDTDPKVILRCSFLQHIISNRKILTNLRTILIGLRRFSMFMVQRYDSLFTQEVAKNTPLENLMKPPTVRYGKSRSVTDDRIAANAEDLQQEFTTFATLVEKMILGENSICEQIRNAFKFECQKIDEALKYIKSLTDKRTQLIHFLIYEDAGDQIPIMKMLMEALIDFQTKWIDKFSEISNDIGSIGTKSMKANLLTCTEDSVMCLPSSFEKDLYRHSYANTAGLNTRSTLVIDVNFLSSKYATCLFGQSHQLVVVGLFSFQDSKNRQLSTLVNKFCTKFKIEPEEDWENVTLLEDFRDGVKGLVVSLKILLSKALETQNTQADAEYEQQKLKAYHSMAKLTVLNQENVEILPDELNIYRMKDLQILRRLIDLWYFPSMLEQLQKKYPQSQADKTRFATQYEKQVRAAQTTNFMPHIQQAERGLKLVFMNTLPFEMLEDEDTKQRLHAKTEDLLEDADAACLRDALFKLGIPVSAADAMTLREIGLIADGLKD